MIKLKAIHVEEFRGIRNLTLNLDQKNFVISGPNGSGKSGIVDAIQFALTGEIGRLTGGGTGELKLSTHGPHVIKRDYPDAAFVELEVYIPQLKKPATIKRKIKNPNRPSISPNTEDIKRIFKSLESHAELTLSRREIIKFILAGAQQRSKDVQTLLKLDGIDQTRATFKTAENSLKRQLTLAKSAASDLQDKLKRHLDISEFKTEAILKVVNQHRSVLELPILKDLAADTVLSEGIARETESGSASSKESILRDIFALRQLLADGRADKESDPVGGILDSVEILNASPEMILLVKKIELFQSGMQLIDDDKCPLCDKAWEIEKLRLHLDKKLEQAKEAQQVKTRLLSFGQQLQSEVQRLVTTLSGVAQLPQAAKEFSSILQIWVGNLQSLGKQLDAVDGLLALRPILENGWQQIPKGFWEELEGFEGLVKQMSDKSEVGKSRDFLVVAQDRLSSWRDAKRVVQRNEVIARRAEEAFSTFCRISEASLVKLYEEVESDFSSYYQTLNSDDEDSFFAKFEPADGKLGLTVDFHKQGMFPPAAYHSEGHQDGMGVCLYLALMKRVMGDHFSLAVLDDVVMSVDSQHRRRFCRVLKTKFPNTQFVITTHDQVWAKQIRTEGLVGNKCAVAFNNWSVDTGPVLSDVTEIWDDIERDLKANEVPTAAARLRRHLEFVATELADILGAKISFRADSAYDLGELLGAVIGRQGELLKQASKAARSWGKDDDLKLVSDLISQRSDLTKEKDGEQWIINKAVHYNEWADLSREDFEPVVAAFKKMLLQFRCSRPNCGTWLSLNSRFNASELSCDCGTLRLHLRSKQN